MTTTYRGELPAPSVSAVQADSGSTLQALTLEVVALDGESTVAEATVELQLLDDPAEFVDPRPDPGRLIQLATSTGGRVLKTPEELAALLTDRPELPTVWSSREAPSGTIRWSGLLLGLLAAEWIIRRRRGLA